MRIDQLHLTAFGRFQGRIIDLRPGLNLIYGPNEAGKTTLQKFMLGMLYGFKKRGQRREPSEDAYRYRPWGGGDYRGTLLYTLDSTGQTIRVERIFDPARDEVRLFDHATGAELTGRFQQDRRKELLFAEEHLRLSEEAFRSTAWVGQLDVGSMESGRELVARVANMAESGREDLSVRTALQVLDDQIREIGSERAPTRPYGRLVRQLEETRRELDRATGARAEAREWEVRLAETRRELAGLDLEIDELNRLLDWAHLGVARARLERLEAGTRRARAVRAQAERLAPFATFPAGELSRLRLSAETVAAEQGRAEALGTLLADLTAAERAQAAALAPSAALLEQARDLEREVAAAEQAADPERSAQLEAEEQRLLTAIQTINQVTDPLEPVARTGQDTLTIVEELDARLVRLQAQLDAAPDMEGLEDAAADLGADAKSARGRTRLWAFGGAFLAVCAGAVWYLSEPLIASAPAAAAALCLLLALVFARRAAALKLEAADALEQLAEAEAQRTRAWQELLDAQRQREKQLLSLHATSPADIRGRLLRYEQLTARRDGLQSQLAFVQAEQERLEAGVGERRNRAVAAIAEALGELDAWGETSQADAESFALAVARLHARQAEVQDQAHRLQELRRDKADAASRLAEAEARVATAKDDAEAVLALAGVATVEEFEAGCRAQESYRQALAEAETLELALSSMTGEQSAEALAAAVDRLAGQVRGEPPEALAAPTDYQAELTLKERRRGDLSVRAGDLAARIETSLKDLPDTADLQRHLEVLIEDRAAWDAELGALQLARATIEAVAADMHREFAPQLNRAMGEIVAELTSGRYADVRIDEELQMRAIDEHARTLDLHSLSGGTVDQFYLALRIALLGLITDGQERVPLLLDDAFVQYDDQRVRTAMAALGTIARKQQVILLTCHRREVAVARESGFPVTIADLTETAEAY